MTCILNGETTLVMASEVIIGLSVCIPLTFGQRLDFAFEMFDLEGSGALSIDSILMIFQVLSP